MTRSTAIAALIASLALAAPAAAQESVAPTPVEDLTATLEDLSGMLADLEDFTVTTEDLLAEVADWTDAAVAEVEEVDAIQAEVDALTAELAEAEAEALAAEDAEALALIEAAQVQVATVQAKVVKRWRLDRCKRTRSTRKGERRYTCRALRGKLTRRAVKRVRARSGRVTVTVLPPRKG